MPAVGEMLVELVDAQGSFHHRFQSRLDNRSLINGCDGLLTL
jgi:hypothetical protein